MARYGCLVLGVIIALIILLGIVYLWSGWLNRPIGRAPAAVAEVQSTARIDTFGKAVYHNRQISRGSSAW